MMKNLRNYEKDFVNEHCTSSVLSASLGVSIESLTYTCNVINCLSKTQLFSFSIQNSSLKINCKYSPFGKITRTTGDIASRFAFRFSSEYFDTETGLVYYNFRYYSPELGRWLSRDPIWERGGVNLYAMVGNDLITGYDYIGLFSWDPRKWNWDWIKPAIIIKTVQQIMVSLILNITATRHVFEQGPETCDASKGLYRKLTGFRIERHYTAIRGALKSYLPDLMTLLVKVPLEVLNTSWYIADVYYYRIYSCLYCCKGEPYYTHTEGNIKITFPPRKKIGELDILGGVVNLSASYYYMVEKTTKKYFYSCPK